tara:strand:- start:4163 stop:5668 length:1506 start_codon:yes stop_codon:yes gene_type:complete
MSRSGLNIVLEDEDKDRTINLNTGSVMNDIKISSRKPKLSRGISVKKQPRDMSDVSSSSSSSSNKSNKYAHSVSSNSTGGEVEKNEKNDLLNDLGGLSNPLKTRPDGEINDTRSVRSFVSSAGSSAGSSKNYHNEQTEDKRQKHRHFSEEERRKIEEEKQELLYKFHRLEQKGLRSSRKFNMKSSLDDMKIEYNRLTRQIEVEGSIKFQRRVLMACVSGLEFMNKRYDPFDVKLDGWSESVMENMEDFDNCFERLHDKYKSKAEVAPEIELLLSLAGSAFMFHLTNTLFKAALPNMNDIAKQNPDLMNNIAQAMMSNMQQRAGMAAPTSSMTDGPPPSATAQPPPPPVNARREMRGPSSNIASAQGLGGLSSMMEGMGPMGDMVSGMMNSVMGNGPIDFPPPPMSGTRANEHMPQVSPPKYNPVVEEVPDNISIASGRSGMSDDLDGIDGISDITSVSSIDFNNTKNVEIKVGGRGKGGKGRGRGRPKKSNTDKNEVTINV